ncbi:SpoIIE family protein phosphatase [Streptomyces sp. NPDC051976]|uniref:SpoIIE family protein phosphatase n=1 Tax=Streptomyces sp. NPDC051976 TaxID=3154947 RepID=UPI0034276D51
MPGAEGAPRRDADHYRRVLAGVLDAVDAGVYAVDGQRLIVAVNPRAASMLARSPEDLLGQDAHDLLHRDSENEPVPQADCPMIHAMESGRTAPARSGWFARGDGTVLPVSWLTTSFRLDEDTAGALVIFHEREGLESTAPRAASVDAPMSEVARLALLAETTTRLTSTLDRDEALRRLAHIVVPRLADWMIVDLIADNDEAWRTAVVHHESGTVVSRDDLCGPLPPVPPGSPLPLSRALRGAASSVATPETYEGKLDSGIAVEQNRLFKATGMHSAVVSPIRGPRDVLGALTLGRAERAAPFATGDLPLLEDITRRTGMALENARLFHRQRRVAETMQRHLLPRLPLLPGLQTTVRYFSAPDASQVGGDWYDMFPLRDGSLAVAVGDVVGHDLNAAAGMAQVRNMLRAHAWSQAEGPAAILSRLDDTVTHVTDVSMATVLFGRLERQTATDWRLSWSNAGHPPPLLIDYEGRARYLHKPHGILLGTSSSPERVDATVTLPPKSTLVLYTDGLVESPGHSLDVGLDLLRQHAAALVHRPLEAFCDQLLARVRPPGSEDDIALLALRVPAHPADRQETAPRDIPADT